jgi:hypothetical protein
MLGKKKESRCNHNFEDRHAIVIDNKYPRLVSVCKKCGLAVHRQIYSIKRATELEN